MATFNIYKLHFTAPLHIGDRRADDSISLRTLHSDTLYAAITACLAKAGCDIPAGGDLGFTLSSLFPYYQHSPTDRPVYFLPMPKQSRQQDLNDVSKAKKLKKVQWVDTALYARVLNDSSFFTDADALLPYIHATYLTSEDLRPDAYGSCEFMRSEVSQRVSLSSRTGEEDAEPYYVDKLVFRHHSGLYFIAQGDTALLDKALPLLAAEGLGTDRNVGFGFFRFATDAITIDLPTQANHQMALSLFIPASGEQLASLLDSDRVAYDFERRGGWITTHPYTTLRKCAIYGFLPGSVFHKDPQQECTPLGKIADLTPQIGDLTPDHPIYRCGRAIMLPINIT